MIRFLIATHGYLADGYKSALGVIIGEEISSKIATLNLYIEDNPESGDAKTQIEQFFSTVAEDDQVVVFTDITHGSVNQLMLPYVDDQRVFVITGVNLPLLCEVITLLGGGNRIACSDVLREAAFQAQKQIIFVNELLKEQPAQDDDECFFE